MTLTKVTSREFKDLVIRKDATSNIGITKDLYGYELTSQPNVLKFVFSSKSTDLSGDRVFPSGIDFKKYTERNPIILLHHDMHDWGIGKTIDLSVEGDKLIGSIEFFTDLDEDNIGAKARAAVEMVKRGVMGISITFIPKEFELNATDGLDITKCVLLESSVVTVPCNTDSYLITPTGPLETVSNSLPDDAAVQKAVDERSRFAAMRRRALDMLD